MYKKRSWQEKLADSKDLPKTCDFNARMKKYWGCDGTLVIPAPMEVDALMRTIPKGKLTTIGEIQSTLAKKHGVTQACPIATGIFAWIAAHAADEATAEGKKRTTPYWRTLKSTGEVNPKYPGGVPKLATRLRAEGHKIVQKGKRFFVADYEKRLIPLF